MRGKDEPLYDDNLLGTLDRYISLLDLPASLSNAGTKRPVSQFGIKNNLSVYIVFIVAWLADLKREQNIEFDEFDAYMLKALHMVKNSSTITFYNY